MRPAREIACPALGQCLSPKVGGHCSACDAITAAIEADRHARDLEWEAENNAARDAWKAELAKLRVALDEAVEIIAGHPGAVELGACSASEACGHSFCTNLDDEAEARCKWLAAHDAREGDGR